MLHLYDLLWICCTTNRTRNPQQIESPQQIHNIVTCQDVVDLLWTLQEIYNKYTTNGISGVYGLVVALQPITWRLHHIRILIMEVTDANAKFLHCQPHHSLMHTTINQLCYASMRTMRTMRACYPPNFALWDSKLNATEEEKNLHGFVCRPHSTLLQVWHDWSMLIIIAINCTALF